MRHEVRIWHDERFMARPFGIRCSCGFLGCTATQQDAERVMRCHLERTATSSTGAGESAESD